MDISKLAEDFIEKHSKNVNSDGDNNDQADKKKSRILTKVKKRLKEQSQDPAHLEPIKRKRGRPPKRLVAPEEPAPKKRRRRRRKFGLVEQIRSGSLKIINVDDLRDELENDHQRDPSPTHMEYIQLLENAEKMNVKYFAISADCDNAIEMNKMSREKSKITELKHIAKVDCEKIRNDEVKYEVKEKGSSPSKESKEECIPSKDTKLPAKLNAMHMWSERDIELILQKVEKAAEAAKAKKEEALHKRKQRQGKKPLTVAQVLAIKRKKSGDTKPVMDENTKEDLEKMLKEAERRSVDLDTLLEEAIKTKDKEGLYY